MSDVYWKSAELEVNKRLVYLYEGPHKKITSEFIFISYKTSEYLNIIIKDGICGETSASVSSEFAKQLRDALINIYPLNIS